MSRNIIALSGGIASSVVADLVLQQIPESELIFTDTKWEDADLFRFLKDLELKWNKEIIFLEDGRSPEELAYDKNFLMNNRVPFCSSELKAKVLQAYVEKGDTVFFGIGIEEKRRVIRISEIYESLGVNARFTLIEKGFSNIEVNDIFKSWNILEPLLYRQGFKHNNCSGGCVRAGEGNWIHLLKMRPEVYAERERVETEFSEWINKPVTFLKNISLKALRERERERFAILRARITGLYWNLQYSFLM